MFSEVSFLSPYIQDEVSGVNVRGININIFLSTDVFSVRRTVHR